MLRFGRTRVAKEDGAKKTIKILDVHTDNIVASNLIERKIES